MCPLAHLSACMYVPLCCICLITHAYQQDSWKRKLRNKFKNLRRPERAAKLGVRPLPKKRREDDDTTAPTNAGSVTPSVSDLEQYERHVQHLQKLYRGRKWVASQLSSLLHETFPLRRKWITEENPTAKDVFEKFPCLQEPKLVSIILIIVHVGI